ncbi:UNVERIFIED_CONTAM: hypothetical protein HDU68_004383, partial [Siphonaria sp. JEL0065]
MINKGDTERDLAPTTPNLNTLSFASSSNGPNTLLGGSDKDKDNTKDKAPNSANVTAATPPPGAIGLGLLRDANASANAKDPSTEKDVKLLKQRVIDLEKENAVLKKSLFDLSIKFNAFVHALNTPKDNANSMQKPLKQSSFTFELDSLEDEAELIDSLVGDVVLGFSHKLPKDSLNLALNHPNSHVPEQPREVASPPPPLSAFSTSGTNLINNEFSLQRESTYPLASASTSASNVLAESFVSTSSSNAVSSDATAFAANAVAASITSATANMTSSTVGATTTATSMSVIASNAAAVAVNGSSSSSSSGAVPIDIPQQQSNLASSASNPGLASPPTLAALTSGAALNLKKTTDAALEYGDTDMASIKTTSSNKESRNFYLKQELKGHTGAIYAIQFSQCGKFVATGSFDKTVRIWEGPSTATTQKEISILKRHTLNISDLCWSEDSSLLLSGGYDQTCKTWDIENGKFLESFDCDGFVQCVMFNPTDKNQFYYGTTRNILGMMDRRKPENAISIHNDGMINSVHVFKDNSYVLTADSNGYLKTWDIRTGKTVQVVLNEPTRKPISHISVCPMTNAEEEPRYIGVNSYDN